MKLRFIFNIISILVICAIVSGQQVPKDDRILCWRNRKSSACVLATAQFMKNKRGYIRAYTNLMCIGMAMNVSGYCNLCYRPVTSNDKEPLCQKPQCACQDLGPGRARVRKASSSLYRKHLGCKLDYWGSKQRRPTFLKKVKWTYCKDLPINNWKEIKQSCDSIA